MGKIGAVNKKQYRKWLCFSTKQTQKTELLAAWKITKDTQIFHQRHPKRITEPKGTQRSKPTHNARESAPTSEQEVLSLQAAPLYSGWPERTHRKISDDR